MKPQTSPPILAALAPVAMAVPPVAVLATLLGVGLLWLLSSDETKTEEQPAADETGAFPARVAPKAAARKVLREDLAEALAYGEKAFTRKEAVEALEALGFRKTAAYKALMPDGKFASMLSFSPDGLVEWKG